MTVLKGFLLAVFVVFPGIALAAYVIGLGLGTVLIAFGRAVGWSFERIGVPEANVWTVAGTLVVAAFVALGVASMRSDTRNRL